MEHLIKGFMRVVRGVDDADELIRHVPELEQSAHLDPSSITEQDRLRLLDFPDLATQKANIAASSTLMKSDLLKRAADTPRLLADAELNLLEGRYWLGVKFRERAAHIKAVEALWDVSEDYYNQVTARFNAMRAPLYEVNEEIAIEYAATEINRRRVEAATAWKADSRQQSLTALGRAKPWVRQLWEENHGEKAWGYAVFVNPAVRADRQRADDYFSRRDGALFSARGAICCGEELGGQWRLECLDYWPDLTAEEEKERDLDEDQRRLARFSKLREYFKSVRDRAPRKQRMAKADTSSMAERGGLPEGMLKNVFLVDDLDCVDSVLEPPAPGNVDNMWLWAVDPEYDEENLAPAPTSSSKDNQEQGKYEGYSRVRVQQLVNNFYCARHFYPAECPMEQLWEAAQESANKAFVSLDKEEACQYSFTRDVGTAMRPSRQT